MAIKGYWRLNGNSNDASGNGNNGTDTAITYSQANGVLNGGAGFNGTSSYIALSDDASLRPTSAFTISAWSRLTDVTNWRTVFNQYNSETGPKLYGIYIEIQKTSGVVWMMSGKGTGNIENTDYKYCKGTIAVNTGKWVLITGVYDGSSLKLYNNGVLNVSVSWANNPAYMTVSKPTIGAWRAEAAVDEWHSGGIDNVVFDSSAWSPAQVKNEYSRIKGFF